MNILFTICGRAGSKGIRNKNIRDFLGKPLPLYTLSAIQLYAERNPDFNIDVALNTDSEQLVEIVSESGMYPVNVIQRKQKLAGDYVAKTEVILDTLLSMEQCKGKKYDMLVDLDLTSPLRTVDNICDLVNKKISEKCDCVFSVTEARRNPYFNMVMDKGEGYKRVIESDYVSRQQAPVIFDMNASMYAYDPQYLKKGNDDLDGHCEVILMEDTGILDLDREGDFELMEVVADFFYRTKPEYGRIAYNIK